MFFSELLRPQSSNRLLRNFRGFLSLEKKLETLQQELYHCILAKPSTDRGHCITLCSRNTEIEVDADLLLPCVLASGVPVKNIKTIKVILNEVTTSNWVSFDILTREGAVIQEIKSWDGAAYSPVTLAMIQQGKLIKFR